MASWETFRTEAPELAEAVTTSFAGGLHKVIATLRRDGSPRVSGTEVEFALGDAWIGSMPGARKALDLQRDPRFAIHGPTVDETMATGDAKIAGRAVEETDPAVIERWLAARADTGKPPPPPEPFHLFRLDVTEVVRTTVQGEELVVESWHEGVGLRTVRRR